MRGLAGQDQVILPEDRGPRESCLTQVLEIPNDVLGPGWTALPRVYERSLCSPQTGPAHEQLGAGFVDQRFDLGARPQECRSADLDARPELATFHTVQEVQAANDLILLEAFREQDLLFVDDEAVDEPESSRLELPVLLAVQCVRIQPGRGSDLAAAASGQEEQLAIRQ